jgi:hypothetical protein
MNKPKIPEKEIDKLQKQFDEFDTQVKEMTHDRMNEAPKADIEPQTKLSQKEIEKSQRHELKPQRTISDPAKFNEKFRDEWNFRKQYVQFIAENREIIGESIELWTRPYGGVGAAYWVVPVNKPVWGPIYLAEQIRKCRYHTLKMEEKFSQDNYIGNSGYGAMYGKMIVDHVNQRLNAEPVHSKKSIFMGEMAA